MRPNVCEPTVIGATYPEDAHPLRGTAASEDDGSVVVVVVGPGAEAVAGHAPVTTPASKLAAAATQTASTWAATALVRTLQESRREVLASTFASWRCARP